MQGGDMLQAGEVVAMLRLHELGWGSKRLSKEFGCARNTVRRYLREGGAVPFKQPARRSAFDGLDDWLRERFFRHDGNADVIRQELASEHGIIIGLRSCGAPRTAVAARAKGTEAGDGPLRDGAGPSDADRLR